jgi:hypothetical protein
MAPSAPPEKMVLRTGTTAFAGPLCLPTRTIGFLVASVKMVRLPSLAAAQRCSGEVDMARTRCLLRRRRRKQARRMRARTMRAYAVRRRISTALPK